MQRMFRYHLTLLQLENYDLKRFFRALSRRYITLSPLRQRPVWTMKLKAIAGLAAALTAAETYGGFIAYGAHAAAGALLGSMILFPLNAALATIALAPLDALMKRRIIAQARRKLAGFPNLTVIGITGSYGKTTMKEALAAVLAEKYAVVKTPDSVNTPVGIARLIAEKLDARTEILIVEMGAYRKGDIAALCALVPPQIAVITGINEAHLERFGTIANTVAAKFEIAENAQEGAFVMMNADDARVMGAYGSRTSGKKIVFYGTGGDRTDYCLHGPVRWSADGLEQSFAIRSKSGTTYETRTSLLGEYAPGTIAGVIAITERLGMDRDAIMRGIMMIRPVPHRLEPFMASGNVLVIDDSYNGNPRGAREAIMVLGRFAGRRKIYCTPGLVEMGTMEKALHEAIGAKLAEVADLVILIRTGASAHIRSGLVAAGFDTGRIREFETAGAAHAALPGILEGGDVILFQNDWPDNYF